MHYPQHNHAPSALGDDQPHVSVSDAATGRAPSSYVSVCQAGFPVIVSPLGVLRTASAARAEDQRTTMFNSVLGEDKSPGPAAGKATGRCRSSHARTCNGGWVISYSLDIPPLGPLQRHGQRTRASSSSAPCSAAISPTSSRTARPRAAPRARTSAPATRALSIIVESVDVPNSGDLDGTCREPGHDHAQLRARQG